VYKPHLILKCLISRVKYLVGNLINLLEGMRSSDIFISQNDEVDINIIVKLSLIVLRISF
jgi:hypothetical protein